MTKKLLKKKTPSDYPQMAIRLKLEDKRNIDYMLSRVIENERKKRDKNSHSPKKNEFITSAMIIGLKVLMKKIKGI